MTDLFFSASIFMQGNLAPGGHAELSDRAINLASGVMGSFRNPLPSNPFAFASLPQLFQMRGGTMQQPTQQQQSIIGQEAESLFVPTPGAQWSAQMQGGGKASIDLGDGYSLQLDENNSEMTIHDANTGETTRIWGDPHVEVNGEHKFDFWGTTTFTLGNGTKITIDTEQYAANPSAYLANNVTITKGNQAIEITGLSQNKTGDLSIAMSNDGYARDAATRDGFVLREGSDGQWISEIGNHAATQADLDMTKEGRLYGPGSTMPSVGEITGALSSFLLLGTIMAATEITADRIAAHGQARAQLV